LPGLLVELPGGTPEIAGPVIRRSTIGSRISPDVPVAFLVRAAGPCFLKPGMLIRGVIGYKIQDDLEIMLVGLLKQSVQVRQGSEERMNIGVIANIIAEIGHGRRIDGGEPESVNAEPA